MSTTDPAVDTTRSGDNIADIQAALDEVVAACHAKGRSDLAGKLRDEVETHRGQLGSVVTVGEAKRGKSSLVNALLGKGDLSPVDIDVTTGAELVFHWADETTVRVDAGPGDVKQARAVEQLPEIPLSELSDWVTVEGNPGNEKGVRSAFVGVDSPLLRQLLLVDTPGVGGLDSGHTRLAVAAAQRADILLFVADNVLSEPEVNFLCDVSDRVATVIAVLTKSDQRTESEQQRIIADNERILRTRGMTGTGPAWFAVSNTLAKRGRRSDPPRVDLLAESGIPQVAEALRGALNAARTKGVRTANLLRLAHSAVAVLETGETARIAGLSAIDPEVLQQLQVEQRKLDSLLNAKAEWPARLDEGLRLVGLTRTDELRAGMREITMRYEEKSHHATRADLAGLPSEVLADVSALTTRIATATADRINQLVDDLGQDLGAQSESFASVEKIRATTTTRDVTIDVPAQRSLNRTDKLSTMVSLSSGRSIGSLVAGLPIFALGGVPFVLAGLGVGVAFAWQMHRGRGELNNQQQFRGWLGHQIAEAQSQLSTDYERSMIDVRRELRKTISGWLDDRRRQVVEALEEHKAAQHRDAAARQKQLESCRRDAARLQELGRRLEALEVRALGVDAA